MQYILRHSVFSRRTISRNIQTTSRNNTAILFSSQSKRTENISEPSKPVFSKSHLTDNTLVQSPAVLHLLRKNNITDVSKITATGPNGRILKGDVLAHIGKIDESTPRSLNDTFSKLSKLDVSNIKAAQPKPTTSIVNKETTKEVGNDTSESSILKTINVEINLSMVEKLAVKLSEQLSTQIPTCDLIYKAAKRAYQRNDRIQTRRPTRTDELFEDLLSSRSKTRGYTNSPAQYLQGASQSSQETCFAVIPLDFSKTLGPTTLCLTETDSIVSTRVVNSTQYDIIDILSGKKNDYKIEKKHELGQRIMKAQMVFDETKIHPFVVLEYLNDIKMLVEQPGSLIN